MTRLDDATLVVTLNCDCSEDHAACACGPTCPCGPGCDCGHGCGC
jgi:hypothetical protein